MNVTTEQQSGVEIMAVAGKIDSKTSPPLEAEMLKWVESPATHFVLDLSQVDYMSSAGLRVLLTMAKRTARNHKTISLAAPSPEVQEILKISNFIAVFKIAPTVQEAVVAATALG